MTMSQNRLDKLMEKKIKKDKFLIINKLKKVTLFDFKFLISLLSYLILWPN